MTVLKCLFMFGVLILASSVQANDSTTKFYSVIGVVEKVAPDHQTATIRHQNIPGYMMGMTMDFPVRDTNELNGIVPGDKITFALTVTTNNDWIENIQRIGETAPVETNAMSALPTVPRELGVGDALPDGSLVAEDGQPILFSDFQGKALAFTFFFTRCPLPNYCPLMNRNFSAARDMISSTTNAPTNWEFLSISFDPENDTPQVLATFGGYYRGDNTSHWLFAAMGTNTLATLAPALDLMVVRQGTSISHNLRTVVLDTQGRIYRQFDGNQWTPQQLAEAMIAAAHK